MRTTQLDKIQRKKKNKLHYKRFDVMYILGLISTFLILFEIDLAGVSLFKYTAIIFGTYILMKNHGKVRYSAFGQGYIGYFLAVMVSVLVILIGESPYKEYSVRTFIDFLFLIFLCIAVASADDRGVVSFFKGVLGSCYIQIVWCFIQMFFWLCVRIDINRWLFVDMLGVLSTASRFENGVLCVSGLSIHPSNLIVVIIFTLALAKTVWKWPACVGIALASRNDTVIIVITVCALIYLGSAVFKAYKNKISKHRVIFSLFVLLLFGILVSIWGNMIVEKGKEVINRIYSVYNKTFDDGSTIAHVSYYTFLPQIWKKFSILEILFGYSYGWTGGMFYYFFGSQYSIIFQRSKLNWGVESDPMNLIYGVGIIGAVAFYKWIIQAMIKGQRINKLYMMILIAVVVGGAFYCVQYSFVIVSEVALTVAINRKIDIFDSSIVY